MSTRLEQLVRAVPQGRDGAWRAATRYVAGTVVGDAVGVARVRPEALDDLTARGIPVRVYIPFGHNWFRYWLRRLAESRGH